MELEKKTTILFPPDLYEHLTRLARQRRSSVGALVREACEARYGRFDSKDRQAAVRELSSLELPVADARSMKLEAVPDPDDIAS